MNTFEPEEIAIIGLGFLGLPLAVEFDKKQPVVGYDINVTRIAAHITGVDSTPETTSDELRQEVRPGKHFCDGVTVAAQHSRFVEDGRRYIQNRGKKSFILFGLKSLLPKSCADWRL